MGSENHFLTELVRYYGLLYKTLTRILRQYRLVKYAG